MPLECNLHDEEAPKETGTGPGLLQRFNQLYPGGCHILVNRGLSKPQTKRLWLNLGPQTQPLWQRGDDQGLRPTHVGLEL
jgi:hypothetical protein